MKDRTDPMTVNYISADPLLEARLDIRHEIGCRICGKRFARLENHLKAWHRKELSGGPEHSTTDQICLNYKRRFGYSDTAPLCCKDLRERRSQIAKGINESRKSA